MKVFLFVIIHIYMNYLISKCECFLSNQLRHVYPDVEYEICDKNVDNCLVFGRDIIPFVFDFKENKNVVNVKINSNNYYVLLPFKFKETQVVKISHSGGEILINVSSQINIFVDGERIFSKFVDDISYSHYEIDGAFCYVYFEGKRNFVVIFENKNLKCASFYDECNISEKEKYFMCKMFDGLNHGKVFHVENKKFEEYVVYLDNFDLSLKERFVENIFFDCVVAGNFNYANQLLCDEIRQSKADAIKTFFAEFDDFVWIDNHVVLIKKNTLAGIYKFEVSNNQIQNIISLM